MRLALSSISSAASGFQTDFKSLRSPGSDDDGRATVRSVDRETAAGPRPIRLTQARIGDTLHDGNGTRVAVINAFTAVNPETQATVRTVDYQVLGAPEQFRVYSDDDGDVARWNRVEAHAAG